MSFGIPTPISLISTRTTFMRRRQKFVKKAPTQLFPINAQRRYLAELNNLVATMINLTKKTIYPKIEKIVTQAKLLRPTTDAIKTDDFSDQIEEVVDVSKQELSEQLPDSRIHQMVLAIGLLVSRHNRKEVLKVISSVASVQVNELFLAEPFLEAELSAFVKQNIGLIRTIPERYFSEIEGILFRGAQQGLSQAAIRQQIAKRFGVSRNRAIVIARDQVGKLNGQLTQLRHQALGIKKYRWRTVGDERVRGNPMGTSPKATPSHWTREGRIFSWSKPPSDGHPGQPILCRCIPEPILS
jgi:SPP1 gp7 family putative phage head morphogenesis protein